MRCLLLTLLLTACIAPAAEARGLHLVRADGTTAKRFQSWIDRAPVPTAPGTVRVLFGQSATHYWPSPRTLYVARGRKLKPGDLFHELGHDFERTALSTAGWEQWAARVGYEGGRDERVMTPHGERWAVEHFADWYAGCASRGRTWRRVGASVVAPYGFGMSRTVARASCSAIFRLDASGRED